MRNPQERINQTSTLQSSISEIEKKLAVIEVKLALQAIVTPTGTPADEAYAREQAELLDYQQHLLRQVCEIPLSRDTTPETFLRLWRHIRSSQGEYSDADMLVLKAEETLGYALTSQRV